MTKFQLCTYKPHKDAENRFGIASMSVGFGHSDVRWIVDCATGEIPKNVWEYKLCEGPLVYIDTEY